MEDINKTKITKINYTVCSLKWYGEGGKPDTGYRVGSVEEEAFGKYGIRA